MGYADTNVRPNGKSIGGAVLANGLLITGIMLAAPKVIPETFKPITIIRIDPIASPPPPPTDNRRTPDHLGNPTRPADPPTQAQTDRRSASTAELTTAGGGDLDFGTEAFLPPVAPQPVLMDARINPRYAGALEPAYPPGMIRAEREGVVTIRVLIGIDGRIKDVMAIRADDDEFLEATRKQALAKWRFLPATRDGVPVESWREMTVRFELPG